MEFLPNRLWKGREMRQHAFRSQPILVMIVWRSGKKRDWRGKYKEVQGRPSLFPNLIKRRCPYMKWDPLQDFMKGMLWSSKCFREIALVTMWRWLFCVVPLLTNTFAELLKVWSVKIFAVFMPHRSFSLLLLVSADLLSIRSWGLH